MKFNFSSAFSGKIDKDKGQIRGLSVITEGPALGHGVDVDTKTLSEIFDLTRGKVVKAFWTHGGPFEGDRLGSEVGLLSGFHIETATKQLKANFSVLDAFRKTYPDRFDYLFELAAKAPNEFGLSIAFSGSAVWQLDDGSEIPADVARPANAAGDNPRVRVDEIYSADFVGSPAANSAGLFSHGKLAELLDTKGKLTGELTSLSATIAAAGEQLKAKDAELIEVTGKRDETAKTLETERATFAAKEAAFLTEKTGLETKLAELSATIATLTEAAKTTETVMAEREAESKAQLEAMNRTLISFGAVPVSIYSAAVDHAATFARITDPEEKSRYWRKNKAAILATAA